MLASVGLDDKADTRIVGLSGGQRRRLDVALGIVGRPELLFLDEPTTGFDPQARRDFWELIRALAAEGTTILLTTHYLDEAENLADRVGVIAAGRLLAARHPRGARRAQRGGGHGLVGGGRHPAQPHHRRRPRPRSRASRPGCRAARSRRSPSPGPRSRTPTSPMIAPHVGHEARRRRTHDPTEVPA